MAVPDAAAATTAAFDREAAWRLHPSVAVRPEEFGALVYHYGTRRLTFLKHPDLAALLRCLSEHSSVRAAYQATGIAPDDWARFDAALERLVETQMLVAAAPRETTR